MARMIPAVIDTDRSPPGEVELFNLLRDNATDSWTVLHSLDLPQHVRQIQGELDFLILIPGGAVVCLEVKSHHGVLRGNDGLWRLGQDVPTTRSPFRQASDAMHSVRQKVAEHGDLRNVPFVSAVAFPRCRFEIPATEWDSYQVFDESDLTNHGVVECLERIAGSHRDKLDGVARAAWFDPYAGEPTTEQCDQIVRILRPRFEQSRSPKARRSEAAGEIRRYTEEQFKALDFHDTNPRVVFTGGAGTGKTLIALEVARRAALAGDNVMLCCYNNLLGDWITRESAPLGERVTTGTLHSIMRRIADVDVPDRASQRFWSVELPERAADVLLDGHPLVGSFDTLVIDEAQDVCTPAYLDVLDLLVKGGLRDGHVFALGDFEHQSIYTGRDARDALVARMQTAQCSLRDNCRNRPRIGSLASSAFGHNPYRGYLRSDDGIEVITRRYTSHAEQLERLAALIDSFRTDGYQLGDIAILSPSVDGAASHLSTPHSGWVAAAASVPGAKIRHTTIHAFKGLEAPAIIVTDINALATPPQRLLLYVAATRATDRLALCVAEAAVPHLQQMIIGGPT